MTDLTPAWLVIGYGNSLRRDDGAGLLLAADLAEVMTAAGEAVHLVLVQQLLPEMAEDLAAPNVGGIVFVDTTPAAASDDPVRIARLGADGSQQGSSHHVGPELLLQMALRLFGRCPSAWLVTIPGWDFDHGETLSAAAQARLEETGRVWQELRQMCEISVQTL